MKIVKHPNVVTMIDCLSSHSDGVHTRDCLPDNTQTRKGLSVYPISTHKTLRLPDLQSSSVCPFTRHLSP